MIIPPQQGPHHLTSDRFARVAGVRVVFDLSRTPSADRAVLDAHARLLVAAAEAPSTDESDVEAITADWQPLQ